MGKKVNGNSNFFCLLLQLYATSHLTIYNRRWLVENGFDRNSVVAVFCKCIALS